MTTFDRPAACLTCQPFESAHPPPLILQPSHSGPITLRVMGMAGSWSDGPQDLGAPSSRAGRPGAARPSQPVDAGASTLRPFLPHTPSFPESYRRPSASLRVRAPLSGLTASGGYSPRLADSPTRCREVGETGAPLPSLRSGRLRRPAREERDSSRRRTSPRRAGGSSRVLRSPSGSRAVFCVRPLWWTAELSTSRQTPGERIHHRCQARADRHPAPVVRQLSFSVRSVLQSPAHAGAQVFALLPRG